MKALTRFLKFWLSVLASMPEKFCENMRLKPFVILFLFIAEICPRPKKQMTCPPKKIFFIFFSNFIRLM